MPFAGGFGPSLVTFGLGGVLSSRRSPSSRRWAISLSLNRSFLEVLAMKKFPVVTDLPADMMQAIGRVIVEYALLELQLSRIIYDLLGVDQKVGRIAVREPRVKDRLEIIFDLINQKRLALTDHEMKLLRKTSEACLIGRDQLAHGTWVRNPETGTLLLRSTKGQWQPVKGQRGKTKHAIKPEGILVSTAEITALGDVINLLSRRFVELRDALLASLRSSRRKRA
ncbi:MAG: hypothetical protein HY521_15605 [Proteobacteria bacterium]|nr:hypothetical protein [Pseudomonadota bacterium]